MTELLPDCDHFIAGAALIGGISYFHAYAYDLLATNERIMAASCDAAIAAHRDGRLRRSPTCQLVDGVRVDRPLAVAEGDERQVPPPLSSYGFQKLAVEYFARAAGTSTSCRTRSSGPSTASASARAGPWATSRS